MPLRVKTHSKIQFLKGGGPQPVALRTSPLAIVNCLPKQYSRVLDNEGLNHQELRLLKEHLLELTPVAPFEHADIGYVVPTKDPSSCTLDATLSSIRKADQGAPIVVVDDGSKNPQTVSLLAKRYDAKVIRLQSSHGPGFARNLGAHHITNEILAFVDSDVELGDDFYKLASVFQVKDVLCCAPRVVSLKMKEAHLPSQTYFELDLGDSFSVVGTSKLAYLPSALLLIRKSTFDHVGGFDTSLFVGEDVDLVTKVTEHGLVLYLPEVRAFHEDPKGHTHTLGKSLGYGLSYGSLHKRYPKRISILPLKIRDRAWFVGSNLLLGPVVASAFNALVNSTVVTWKLKQSKTRICTQDVLQIATVSMTQSAQELLQLWLRTCSLPLLLLSIVSSRARRLLAAVVTATVISMWKRPQETIGYRVAADLGYSLGVVTSIVLELLNRTSQPNDQRVGIMDYVQGGSD